jgi:hypothetical protein
VNKAMPKDGLERLGNLVDACQSVTAVHLDSWNAGGGEIGVLGWNRSGDDGSY